MEPAAIQIIDLWHLLAGFIGAFGNQVLYWGARARAPKRSLNRRMMPISVAYIVTGAGVGFIVGVEFDVLILALGSGATWPETIKAIDAARTVGVLVAQKVRGPRDGPSAAVGPVR